MQFYLLDHVCQFHLAELIIFIKLRGGFPRKQGKQSAINLASNTTNIPNFKCNCEKTGIHLMDFVVKKIKRETNKCNTIKKHTFVVQ